MNIEINKIIYSKRKTIALQLTDDDELIIKAPINTSEKDINNIVLKHKKWIEGKKKELIARDPKFSKKEFINGEGFLYYGKLHRLWLVDNQEVPLMFDGVFFYLSKNSLSNAREHFIKLYKEKAFEKISQRVNWYAQQRGFRYNKINITNAQKRWGSCSSNGNLNFSWRLIMCPIPVLDYVVVHELVHLEEKNHSVSFWKKVKMLMYNYEEQKNWLKNYGYLMRL